MIPNLEITLLNKKSEVPVGKMVSQLVSKLRRESLNAIFRINYVSTLQSQVPNLPSESCVIGHIKFYYKRVFPLRFFKPVTIRPDPIKVNLNLITWRRKPE